MSKKLPFSYVLVLGMMLFAMFFGAGNLIFPAILGQEAGTNVVTVMTGFVLTGIFLPLASVLTLVYSGKNDVEELAARVSPGFGIIFAVVMYLSIGPFFAMPRTGTVAFEIGIKPFSTQLGESTTLFLFTLIFFSIACVLSLAPGKVVDVVGKYLTPVKILLITLLVAVAVLYPMGPIQAPTSAFETGVFGKGFKEGYLTVDGIAAFAFAPIIVSGVRARGTTSLKHVSSAMSKASVITGALLLIMYGALSYMSATSVNVIGYQSNGGEVLAKVCNYYFGLYGSIILAAIITVACMTTAIGLVSSCALYFNKILPKISYKKFVVFFSLFSFGVSNLGLTSLIKISAPVLNGIYPVAICLVVLIMADKLFHGKKRVYQVAILFSAVVGLFDGLKSANISFFGLSDKLDALLPLSSISLGFVVPAIIGGMLGYIWSRVEEKNRS
ncbi:branched-chain amino acid transport system II carrier protein [Vagococcus sp. PNs007]|uniref:Branched-chain amino acid transport system carrier protein n=1 Tax=Vagococcus proximus TaxID=2991417 RepID=A0ABT5X3Y5_9ENTE|nr:branched-chain amino acid transport system II carrier protein [Vagococcus proximus]MDF0480706.1 branched-chain amino acid transport system II carrier protein [Vagococcus proximus]